MRPMNTTPAPVAGGISIAISAFPHFVFADHFGLTLEWRIGQEVP